MKGCDRDSSEKKIVSTVTGEKKNKKIYLVVIIKPFKKKVYNKSRDNVCWWEMQKTIQTAALLFFFPAGLQINFTTSCATVIFLCL